MIQNYWDCLDFGGEWVNPPYNFDDIAQALKTQFILMSIDGWTKIYQQALNRPSSHYTMPIRNSDPWSIVFFGLCIFVSALFMLNMFVGVVLSTFYMQKEKVTHGNHLTKLEGEYIDICSLCYKAKPQKRHTSSGFAVRDRLYQIAVHRYFDWFIFACIFANTLTLMLYWPN